MARFFEIFFHIYIGITERRFGFVTRSLKRIFDFVVGTNDAHASSAAPRRRFDNHRHANFIRQPLRLFDVFHHSVAPGDNRHSRFLHRILGKRLVPHRRDHFRLRPDELQAGGQTNLGELCILRQKSVSRMNGVGVGDFCCGENTRNIEIAFLTCRRADTYCFIGKSYME